MLEGLVVVPARGRASTLPPGAVETLAREFPTVSFAVVDGQPSTPEVSIDVAAWRRPDFDFWAFDRWLDAVDARGFAVWILGGEAHEPWTTALEVLTRAQRLVRRRNRSSGGPAFDRLLERHRALHELSKPLVRADYDHALDVWQWMLRLAPDAGLEVQAAALLHDVERLVSEPDLRVEHHARDYHVFKDAHAAAGAALAARTLADAGFDAVVQARVSELVCRHERPSDDLDASLLNDADALSFFSLNSAGFLDYFGLEHTSRKIAYTLARLGPRAKERLDRVRLRPDVARLVRAVRTEVAR